MSTYKEIAEFYASAPSEDARVEYLYDGKWIDPYALNPTLIQVTGGFPKAPTRYNLAAFRWKTPAKTPVDMSVFIDSGVDMEFGSHSEIGCLLAIKEGDHCYVRRANSAFSKCKPRMNHWMHSANIMKDGFILEHIIKAGFIIEWERITSVLEDSKIVFRITGLQDDRCMPWEV